MSQDFHPAEIEAERDQYAAEARALRVQLDQAHIAYRNRVAERCALPVPDRSVNR